MSRLGTPTLEPLEKTADPVEVVTDVVLTRTVRTYPTALYPIYWRASRLDGADIATVRPAGDGTPWIAPGAAVSFGTYSNAPF